MDVAGLAAFTPVALDFAPPAGGIDWGDLSGLRFAEPFFDQTVERWAGGSAPRLVRTDFSALAALDEAPSLEPSALIFHLSRCGSTLVSRLLAALPGTLVIAEPRPLNALLMADPAALGEAEQVRLLRLLVRALGRRRFGDERRYVLKLSSWNVTRLDLFRRAFPGVPLIWVQRAPEQVVASIVADPPGWNALRRSPAAARRLFGMAPETPAALDAAGFCAHMLEALLGAAHAARQELLVVDYRELPQAVWTRLAPLLGLSPDAAEVVRLAEEARFYSKDPRRRIFAGDPADRPALAEGMRALVADRLEPLYRALDPSRTTLSSQSPSARTGA